MLLTKPDRGWAWVIAGSSFGAHCIGGYLQYASGMVHIVLLETFHASVLKTSWISALFLLLISAVGPLASSLINRFNCRITMIIGSILLSTGMVTTAFIPDINYAFLTFGLLSGIGSGICYNTGLIVLGLNFEKKRNVACGLAISGAGIGPFILTPIYEYIYQTYGREGFFLLLGGLALQDCIFATTFRESVIERKMKRMKQQGKNKLRDSFQSYLDILQNLPMFCLCICLFLVNISIFLLYLHFPEYCLQTHSTKFEISMFMSIAGIWSAVGKILFGMANNSYNIDETVMFFGTFIVLASATVIFPIFRHYNIAKLVYSSILGCYSGCCWIVVSTLVVNILGYEKLAHGIGYLMVYVGLGSFIGPPLAGYIVDNGGTYGISFTAAGLLLIVGAFLGLFSSACGATMEKEQEKKELKLIDFEIKTDSGKDPMINEVQSIDI